MNNIRKVIGAPITDIESAKAYIRGLKEAKLDFHFEDDPADVINVGTGERTFTDEEACILNRRVYDLYEFNWGEYECPIGYLLSLEGVST